MELQKKLNSLEDQIARGRLMEGLTTHEGFAVLREDILNRLEAYKRDAMSDKYINDHNAYLAVVGGHNALKSLLDTIELHVKAGVSAAKEKQKIEDASKEEIDRLGIQSRI